MPPLVSIGLPFRNAGNDLLDALKSVFAQTYSNWELIAIDDGSSDHAAEVFKRLSHDRIRFFQDGVNKGLVPRLNEIIGYSNGKYIARLDADDMMHPRRIETQVRFLESNPAADIVDTALVVLDQSREPKGIRSVSQCHGNNIYNFFKYGVVMHATVMARAEWFRKNLYHPDYIRAEDREIFIRNNNYKKVAHLEEALYFCRVQGNVRKSAFLTGYRSERKVLLNYGPKLIGFNGTAFLYLRSLLKSMVLRSLHFCGKQQFIARSNTIPLEPDVLDDVRKQIWNIQSLKLEAHVNVSSE